MNLTFRLFSARWIVQSVVAASLGGGLLLTPMSSTANPASAPLPYQSLHKTEGAVTCASSLCHGAINTWKDSNVLQNEYITWSRLDKHARAYNVLLNEQSKRIAKKLGLAEAAHQAKICLDCHAHNIPASRHGERFTLQDNITCEACHGPAEKWLRPHVSTDATHAKNISAGMYPTNDPQARAKLCLSCHFGNKDKLVTHRIMGAGHPRLSFELENFTALAPRHFAVDHDYSQRKRVWDGVKVWAIGQALAVTATLDLLNDDIRGRDGLFPELVLFDCHACHRSMAENRLQTTTPLGVRATPGLVRLNDANMLMLRVIARALEPALGERVSTQTVQLHRAIAGEGDVRQAAKNMQALASQVIKLIESKKVDHPFMTAIAAGLVDDGINGMYRDYAAAEQATLAIASVGQFMAKQGTLKSVAAFNRAWQQLNALLQNDEQFKPNEFTAQLRALRPTLNP